MGATRNIELDAATADALEIRAAERGLSVGQVVAELVSLDSAEDSLTHEEIAEMDRQWADLEAGAPTVPHDTIVQWLETWGTAAFRPFADR